MVRASLLAAAAMLLAAAQADGAAPLSISVRFAWDDLKRSEMTTDRGFAVRLDSAEVMSAGFALVPCAEQGAEYEPRGGAVIRIGHFSGMLPNQLPLERSESLRERKPFAIDGFDPPDIAYCQAHYVLGGPRGGFSLKIEGSYRAPGSETWTAFSVVTPETFGTFVPLLSIQRRAVKGRLGSYRAVSVVRPASGWFDGIDFTTTESVAIGHTVLRRIANGTTVTLMR